jgi:hypothetical protein
MKRLLTLLAGLALVLAARAETEQSVSVSQPDTKTYTQDGKRVTDRTIQIREHTTESGPKTFKTAIFVSNRIPKMTDKMSEFEDLVTGRITDLGFQVFSKEIIADSLRQFDPALAGSARPADSLDTKLSEQSSAVHLAQGLGADYLLVVSLSSIGTKTNAVNAYGVNRITQDTTLRFTYKILDGQTGASITAGTDKVVYSAVQSENAAEKSDDVPNELMDQAADKIAQDLQSKVAQNRITAVESAAAPASVRIEIEAADLVIPDVRIDKNNTVQISEGKFSVHPLNATVELDGVAIGTAPGTVQIKPGFSKLRITRDGYKTWERTINATNGLVLTVALELSPDGYSRWKDATAFLNVLKNGATLTDAQAEELRGKARMFEQSGYKVNTKDAPATNIFMR